MTGRVLDISESDYEADKFFDDFPTLRSSICWKLIERGSTPRHAWYASPRLNPNFEQEHRKIFDKGAAAHALLLGKGKQFQIIKCPNYMTKEARSLRDAAYAEGKIPLLEKDYQEAVAMADAARDQLSQLVEHGTLSVMPFGKEETERVLIWEDRGVWCRARVDHLPNDGEILLEYKSSAASAAPELFPYRNFRQLGYDCQVAFYRRGLEACGVATSPQIAICVQENYPPYLMSYNRIDDEVLMRANEKIERALKIWRGCLESGEWPGYSAAGYDINLTERERAEMDAAHAANGASGSHVTSEDVAATVNTPSNLFRK
ncbi:MAG: PD-(D/E)XK nuclease-like domain-containing protein [Bradyrhizobium sp.]|nr:PD-(D/E)XK nuclease-like domain-containing protein [Bradyrhizobium sp.]